MTVPARASKLDPYGEEILAVHRQGRKLAEIGKHLAHTYGLSVALSTLSEYVNRPRTGHSAPAVPPPPGTPAQEMLLDQVEVYAEIQASVRVLVEEMQAMRNAFPDIARIEQQVEALGRQIADTRSGPAATTTELPEELKTLLPSLRRFLDSQQPKALPSGATVPAHLLRRIWVRAFWMTTGLWLSVVLIASYLLGFWQAPLR